MAERGATPPVPRGRRMLLRAVRHLFKPLKPDDYLEMINPLWTTKELRGQVERVEARGSEAASVLIRPSYEWPGHQPGQYVRLGLVIDGRYHWRAYSLTSDPRPEDGLISVTPKKVDTGVVSPYLVEKIQPGELVRLGEIEGQFVLPEPLPAKLLFISAGSGITPIISMLRSLDHHDQLGDVVVFHSDRVRDHVMFLDDLEDMAQRHDGVRLDIRLTSERGRFAPKELDDLCPDWREREAFCWARGSCSTTSSSTGTATATRTGCTTNGSSRRSAATPRRGRAVPSRSSTATPPPNATAAHRFSRPGSRPGSSWRSAAASASATPAPGR